MVVRISRSLKTEREIPLGFGVSMTFRPFGFADYKEAEAWAHRTARERLTGAQEAALAGLEVDEMGAEFQDRLIGLAAEMLLDRLVTRFAAGWSGVEELDENDPEASRPLPLTPETWEMFRSELPVLVDILDRQLQRPMHAIVTEGNGSAPSPDTGAPEG